MGRKGGIATGQFREYREHLYTSVSYQEVPGRGLTT